MYLPVFAYGMANSTVGVQELFPALAQGTGHVPEVRRQLTKCPADLREAAKKLFS